MTDQKGERINLYLSHAGICSRREADRMVEAGRVTVDGVPVGNGYRVCSGQSVCVDGKPVGERTEELILAVYKPKGVVCTTDRRWGDPVIEDLVDVPQRVFSAGRLDKNSEGLILMTNQGDLVNRIMRSSTGHEKEYVVTVNKTVEDVFLRNLEKGVFLPELGVTTLPCKTRKSGTHEFHIILTQGLNRQIRRMCEAYGYRVTKLVRIRIMNICLGDLEPGKWRPLSAEEKSRLYNAAYADGKQRAKRKNSHAKP